MSKVFNRLAELSVGGITLGALRLSNVLGGGLIALVAFGPQALPYGLAAAFVAGTLGAILASAIARTPGEIIGPVAGLSIIYAILCADLVARAGADVNILEILLSLSLAVFLMGVIQVIAAVTRIVDLIRFFPVQITAGFSTGTGILLIWSQTGAVLGLTGGMKSFHWNSIFDDIKPWAVFIGLLVILITWLTPRLSKRLHPLIAGLTIGTLVYHVLRSMVDTNALGPMVGNISVTTESMNNFTGVWGRLDVDRLFSMCMVVLPYSGLLALAGTVNAAIGAANVADVTNVRPNIKRILLAHGIANALCGLLAALPVGSSLSLSMVAAKMRSINSVVPLFSAVLLLVGMVTLMPVVALTPIVVLAGILISAGFGLLDPWTKNILMQTVRRGNTERKAVVNSMVVLAIAASMVFGNISLALLVGAVLATGLLLIELSTSTRVNTPTGLVLKSTKVRSSEQSVVLRDARPSIQVFRPRGGLFFATADQLSEQLMSLNAEVRYCVIDCSQVTVLDVTVCRVISSRTQKLAEGGVITVLAGLDPKSRQGKALIQQGLNSPSSQDRWFRDLDHALEWIENSILRASSPELASDKPVAFEQTQLVEGLEPSGLKILRQHVQEKNLNEGDKLFTQGEPGSSIYIMTRGSIEISVGADVKASNWRRMAALGPGCLFGEVAMLTGGMRSANAICVQQATLYELTQEALDKLKITHSNIHAQILQNLSKHLAIRLISATEVAQNF